MDHAFLDEHDLAYENLARRDTRPPAAAIQSAIAAAASPDEPGMFEADYAETDEEADYQAEQVGNDATTMLMREVLSPAYVMPRRIRCRIPSGPYRILSASEREIIERFVDVLIP